MPAPWGSGAAPSPSLSTLPARHLLLMVRHTWAEAQPGAPSGTWLLVTSSVPAWQGFPRLWGSLVPSRDLVSSQCSGHFCIPKQASHSPILEPEGGLGRGQAECSQGQARALWGHRAQTGWRGGSLGHGPHPRSCSILEGWQLLRWGVRCLCPWGSPAGDSSAALLGSGSTGPGPPSQPGEGLGKSRWKPVRTLALPWFSGFALVFTSQTRR